MLAKLGFNLAPGRRLCRLHCGLRQLCTATQLRPDTPNTTPTAVSEDSKNTRELAKSTSEPSEELGPCVLGLFSGRINKNLLYYPELDSMTDVDALHGLAEPVEKFFAEHVDSRQLDSSAQLSPELLSGLRALGLFGLSAPATLGGRDLSVVAQARLIEAASADASVELTLRAHTYLGLSALLSAGSEAQLAKFAGPLVSGQQLAAFCLAEPGGGGGFADLPASVRATARLGEDAGHWVLNGTKIWVTNGPHADVFIVFALTTVQPDVYAEESREMVTAFLVDRTDPGVSVGPPEPKLGARAAATGSLHLANARIPADRVLGNLGEGAQLARKVTSWSRIAAGAAAAGSLKRLLVDAVARCSARRPLAASGGGADGGRRSLAEFPLVQRRMARLTGLTYAVESVAYQTAFLADQFPDADLSAEAAALGILVHRATLVGASETAALFGGGRACDASGDFPHERRLRDAWTLAGFESPPDLVRLQLAGWGARRAAEVAADEAAKFLAARGFLQRLRMFKSPALVGDSRDPLAVHFHHNMAGVANSLEVNTASFSNAVRYCLHYFKEDLPAEQMLMCRMADCAVDLYTLLACCARASRSKSIGLRSADQELELLIMLSKEATLRLQHNISGLDIDTLYTRHPDGEYRSISDYTCKFGGYSVDHAVSRNWN